MSGGYFESLATVNTHELQYLIGYLLSFLPKEK